MIHPRVLFTGDPAAATPWVGIAKKLARVCYDLKIASKVYKLGSGVKIRVENIFSIAGTLAGISKVWIEAGGITGFFIGYPRNEESIYGWQTVGENVQELSSYIAITSHYYYNETRELWYRDLTEVASHPGNGYRDYKYVNNNFTKIFESSTSYGQQYAYIYTYSEDFETYTQSNFPVCSWSSASSGDLPVRVQIGGLAFGNYRVSYDQSHQDIDLIETIPTVAPFLPVCRILSNNYITLSYYNHSSYVYASKNWLFKITENNADGVFSFFNPEDIIFGVHAITEKVFIVVTVSHFISPLTVVGTYYTSITVSVKFWLVDARIEGADSTGRPATSPTLITQQNQTLNYSGYRISFVTLVNPMLYKYPFRFSESGGYVSTIRTDFVSNIQGFSRANYERSYIRTWPITTTYNEETSLYSVSIGTFSDSSDTPTIVWGEEGTETNSGASGSTWTSVYDKTRYMRTYNADSSGSLSSPGVKVPYALNYTNDILTVCYARYEVELNRTYNSVQVNGAEEDRRDVEKISSGIVRVILSFDNDDDNYVEIYNCKVYDEANFNDELSGSYNVRENYWGHGDPSYGIGSTLSYVSRTNDQSTYDERVILGEESDPQITDIQYFKGSVIYLNVKDKDLYVKNYSRQFLYKSDKTIRAVTETGICNITSKTRNNIGYYKLSVSNGSYVLNPLYENSEISEEENNILDLNVKIANDAAIASSFSDSDNTYNVIGGGYSNFSAPLSTYMCGVDLYSTGLSALEGYRNVHTYPNIDYSSSFAVNNTKYLACTEFYSTYGLARQVLIISNLNGFAALSESNIGEQENVSITPVGIRFK